MQYPLDQILKHASATGASSVLLVAGKSPVVRYCKDLQEPFGTQPLSFRDTELIANSILNSEQKNSLNELGSVESSFNLHGVEGTVTIFYGLGCHNLVFHLDA